MNPLAGLLDQEPVVVTVGAALLADAVESQGAKVARTDWRPPLPGTGEALAVLASDPGTGRARRGSHDPDDTGDEPGISGTDDAPPRHRRPAGGESGGPHGQNECRRQVQGAQPSQSAIRCATAAGVNPYRSASSPAGAEAPK